MGIGEQAIETGNPAEHDKPHLLVAVDDSLPKGLRLTYKPCAQPRRPSSVAVDDSLPKGLRPGGFEFRHCLVWGCSRRFPAKGIETSGSSASAPEHSAVAVDDSLPKGLRPQTVLTVQHPESGSCSRRFPAKGIETDFGDSRVTRHRVFAVAVDDSLPKGLRPRKGGRVGSCQECVAVDDSLPKGLRRARRACPDPLDIMLQ